MSKWLLTVVLVIIVGWALWFQVNTTKIAYVNGLDAYAHMPGREYILQKDCYVFSWRHTIATAHPLLGINAPDVAARTPELPPEVTRANVEKPRPGVRIMDVIPKGTRFRILSVRMEESRRTGISISYEIYLLDNLERPYPRVDLRAVQLPVKQPTDAPEIDPAIAVPWIKR